LAERLTRELISMRDALVSLSLSLKDWQFELDQRGNRVSEQIANQELEKFRLHHAPTHNEGLCPKSSTTNGK
jgi:hypothetical protein